MNENHLFEAMGLTQTNEQELSALFSPEMNEFLKSHTFITKEEKNNKKQDKAKKMEKKK